MATTERRPFFVCDGCNVQPPHEHRCHGANQGPVCGCIECSFECDGCGVISPADHKPPHGWFFGTPHPSDGIGVVLCPACAPADFDG